MVYRIKITLERISPPIWRRIDVAESFTLLKLHQVLQIVMGWEDCHLHEFNAGGQDYGNLELEEDPQRKLFDERSAKLKQIVAGKPGTELRYLYDFGDYWPHDLVIESVPYLIPASSIRTAWLEKGVVLPRMWGAFLVTSGIWKSWPTRAVKSTRTCSIGADYSTRSSSPWTKSIPNCAPGFDPGPGKLLLHPGDRKPRK